MPLYLVFISAFLTSVTTAILVPIALIWLRRRKNISLPGKDRMLRPAGESLRVKINELNDELMLGVVSVVVIPFAMTCGLVFQGSWQVQLHYTRAYVILASSLIGGAIGGFFLHRIGTRLSNHNLGFLGERLVGEALAALQAQGCRVFHDIPMDGPANLDHVLVTPTISAAHFSSLGIARVSCNLRWLYISL